MNRSQKVLVIDDEHDIHEGVSYWLRAAGFKPLFADDAQQGINLARENQPDAILLDVQMPHKDGIEILHELREDDQTSWIPVIMLSASLREEYRALDAGARFFLQKPYEGYQLVSALHTALMPSLV